MLRIFRKLIESGSDLGQVRERPRGFTLFRRNGGKYFGSRLASVVSTLRSEYEPRPVPCRARHSATLSASLMYCVTDFSAMGLSFGGDYRLTFSSSISHVFGDGGEGTMGSSSRCATAAAVATGIANRIPFLVGEILWIVVVEGIITQSHAISVKHLPIVLRVVIRR